MWGFLLDSHIPKAVVAGVKQRLRTCEIAHIAQWRGGDFLDRKDGTILEAAHEENLVFVTYDADTIPDIVNGWIANGREMTGVAFLSSSTIPSDNVGGIVRALVHFYEHPELLSSAYPIAYLHP